MIPTILATLHAKLPGLFREGYRPERHYMRGPGPACRRKARPPALTGTGPCGAGRTR